MSWLRRVYPVELRSRINGNEKKIPFFAHNRNYFFHHSRPSYWFRDPQNKRHNKKSFPFLRSSLFHVIMKIEKYTHVHLIVLLVAKIPNEFHSEFSFLFSSINMLPVSNDCLLAPFDSSFANHKMRYSITSTADHSRVDFQFYYRRTRIKK